MSSPIETIRKMLENYFVMSEDEALDLYDALDTLYNEIKSKYLELLLEPDKNKELVKRMIRVTTELLSREERTFEEELQLIALLDILATDLHDRFVGFVVEEKEEDS